MNLVVEKIQEIQRLIVSYRKKEITHEEAQFILSASAAARKWAQLAIQAYAIDSKNKRAIKALERINILDETTAIDVGLIADDDAVKCDVQEKLISRSECLEYSGSHYNDCKGCDVGRATKEKLLGREE